MSALPLLPFGLRSWRSGILWERACNCYNASTFFSFQPHLFSYHPDDYAAPGSFFSIFIFMFKRRSS